MNNVICVGGEEYEVLVDLDAHSQALADYGGGPNTVAMVNHMTNQITMNPLRVTTPMKFLKALLHEVLHILEVVNNDDFSEGALDRTAQQLAIFLVDNGLVDPEGLHWESGME